MIIQNIINEKANEVLQLCRKHKFLLATVESCTGGMIVAALTDIAGSSDVVECGFVTYSNQAKIHMVGIDEALLNEFGAVSKPVAIAMANGALQHSRADVSVAVTGIAGPGGGSDEKPVGLVHIAVGLKRYGVFHSQQNFGDIGRSDIRLATVDKALSLIIWHLHKI